MTSAKILKNKKNEAEIGMKLFAMLTQLNHKGRTVIAIIYFILLNNLNI